MERLQPLTCHVCNNSQPQGLIGLGANLQSQSGSPAETLHAALEALNDGNISVQAVSRFRVTQAFPPDSGPDYVNAAAVLTTRLSAQDVLSRLHEIEAQFGRRRAGRWESRILDLDLLALGDAVLPDRAEFMRWHDLAPQSQMSVAPDTLILPHPRLHERAFVLVPLHDIAPGWCHPVLGQTVAEMLAALPESVRRSVRFAERG